MLRRKLLTVLAAAAALGPSALLAKLPRSRLSYRHTIEAGVPVCYVIGSVDQIERFHDAWQTFLWPDWKTHRASQARDLLDDARPNWEASGEAMFYEGDERCRAAIAHAKGVCRY